MYLFLALLFAASATVLGAFRHVPAGQVYSLHRRGKRIRLLQPGIHMVLPLLDRIAHKINLAGQMLKLEAPASEAPQVRGTVYWQVLEPERADAVFEQVDQLIRRGALEALRGETGSADGDFRALGARLKHDLNRALRERGMMVTRVDLETA